MSGRAACLARSRRPRLIPLRDAEPPPFLPWAPGREYLAKLDINIEQLDTSTVEIEPGAPSEGEAGEGGGAETGRAVFVMEALIGLPPDVAVDQVGGINVIFLCPSYLRGSLRGSLRCPIYFVPRLSIVVLFDRCWKTSSKSRAPSVCRSSCARNSKPGAAPAAAGPAIYIAWSRSQAPGARGAGASA